MRTLFWKMMEIRLWNMANDTKSHKTLLITEAVYARKESGLKAVREEWEE